MGKYLLARLFDFDKESCWIIEASSKAKAIEKFSKFYCKQDETFLEALADRCVNMSFAEKFWIQTEEEDNHFSRTGKILIDENEFRRRVQGYFSETPKFAKEYLDFYFSDASIEMLSDDFLFHLWVLEFDERDYTVINIKDIIHL